MVTYRLNVTEAELNALRFAAGRYLWAQELLNRADRDDSPTDDTASLSLRESDAWAVADAAAEESSEGTADVLRAVLSEDLVSKVLALLDSIV